MSTDVKLAILAGVGLISVFALVYYKKDISRRLMADTDSAASTSFPNVSRARQYLPTPTYEAKSESLRPRGKNGFYHRVHPGDTLVGLAQRYYGDGDRFIEI